MRRTGQWLRFIGLLIEMIGFLGVLRDPAARSLPRFQIPGGPVVSIAWVAFVLGLVVWLVGQILIAAGRPPRRTP